MARTWIEGAAGLLIALALSGCATHKDKLLTRGDSTMLDIWQQETGGGGLLADSGLSNGSRRAAQPLLDARQALRRPLVEADLSLAPTVGASYTRTASTEIQRQFLRLPNPDLVMYVFPHLAGTEPAPVPGYSTVFPFYRRVQYAMPGERLEDY